MTNKDITFIRNKEIIARQIHEDFVVLDINEGKLYKLNATAKTIWKYLSKPRTLDEVTKKILNEFNVSSKSARREATSFLEEHLGSLFLKQ